MTIHATVREVNFDSLVGPTHNFGGLSFGNVASLKNKARAASPKKAALQGLKKMHFLASKGFTQAVFPPHPRPHFPTLKSLGFDKSRENMLRQAYEYNPQLFFSLCSSSFMWAANTATVCPSSDSLDKKTHFTPSNLATMFHRSIEGSFAYKVLRAIFSNEDLFTVHQPLPSHDMFSDEGAANHNRLSISHNQQGLQLFIFGKPSLMATQKTSCFPARQSKMANDALARLHKLRPSNFMNLEQNHLAIDGGAFHNDVVCVINENVLLIHEMALTDQAQVLSEISNSFHTLFGQAPHVIEISNNELPLSDALSSYLFNSQLLSKADGKMLLFAPTDSQSNSNANKVIDSIISGDNPIDQAEFFDVSESMANGGGPACMRLRVLLNQQELSSLNRNCVFSEKLYTQLHKIIDKYYVDELALEDFFNKSFLDDCDRALMEIANALDLKGLYH